MKNLLIEIPALYWNGHQFDVLNNDKISDDLTIVSALKYVLQYQGIEISKKMIAGLTGAAFYIGWNRQTMMSGMGGAVFQFPHMGINRSPLDTSYCGYNLLFQYLGLEMEIVPQNDTLLFDKCKKALENDIPLAAIEWDPMERRGHAAVLCGIDYENRKFLSRIYDHEKCEEIVRISPQNLSYIILQKSKNRMESDKEEIIAESLKNAYHILRGNYFDDREKWILGIQAYEKQCDMVKNELDVRDKGYKLMEHFLFWRLQVLLICRTYAYLYMDELINRNLSFIVKEQLDELKKNFKEFISLFNNSLEIRNDLKSIIGGTPLVWKAGSNNKYIQEVLNHEKGKMEYCDFLKNLHDIDKKAVIVLEKITQMNQ